MKMRQLLKQYGAVYNNLQDTSPQTTNARMNRGGLSRRFHPCLLQLHALVTAAPASGRE
jgi:hypothetical protein